MFGQIVVAYISITDHMQAPLACSRLAMIHQYVSYDKAPTLPSKFREEKQL